MALPSPMPNLESIIQLSCLIVTEKWSLLQCLKDSKKNPQLFLSILFRKWNMTHAFHIPIPDWTSLKTNTANESLSGFPQTKVSTKGLFWNWDWNSAQIGTDIKHFLITIPSRSLDGTGRLLSALFLLDLCHGSSQREWEVQSFCSWNQPWRLTACMIFKHDRHILYYS